MNCSHRGVGAERVPPDTRTMHYDYSGYLRTLLKAPDASVRDSLDYIEFDGDDLAKWTTRDLPSDNEWRRIPVHRARIDEGVRLVGRFEDIRKMDTIPSDSPSIWVPLGSLGWNDSRFPIDLERYPIAEVTYRCTSDNARPAWVWTYPGGIHLDMLPPSRAYRRLVRRIAHFGFPKRLDHLIFRLYATTRTTESFEIASVRFRAMSPAEKEACTKDEDHLRVVAAARQYPLLDEFLPLGVCMNLDTVRRNAELLGISLSEYWDLCLEDVVTHHHNAIMIERADGMSVPERDQLLAAAEHYGVKLVPIHDFNLSDDPALLREMVDTHIRPVAKSKAILAWILRNEPPEIEFRNMLQAKTVVDDADSEHPVCVITRHPSSFPLYAPYFAVAGINHYTSHAPWELGEIVRTHLPLGRGQQFWVLGPTFVFATDAPEWSTCPELRLMVNLSFANGARGWFSHSYHNDPIWILGSVQRSLTGPFLTFSDLWLELDSTMERLNALAPLLLQSKPARMPSEWYAVGVPSHDFVQMPEGVPAISSYRLKGPNFNLYTVVSNDVRGMSVLNVNIPDPAMHGREIYDLTDFLTTRTWEPMRRDRHLEMFPGQARAVLVAEPEICTYWRDEIARRLTEDDRRQLFFNMNLARAYGLNTEPIERIAKTNDGSPIDDLETMDCARDMLVDLMYMAASIRDPNSKITEASAAICACDGVLCRLISRGKMDLAKEWGLKVIPLAREMTHLRLEIRRGRGHDVLRHCEDLTTRVLHLLADIRALK